MRRTSLCGRVVLGAFCFFAWTGIASAQNIVSIEKSTNGQDADTAPGPVIVAGAPVSWSYVVTNTGSRDLANIVVTDDQGVTVSCPGTTLAAGESFICTANGTAVEGQYVNIGTVTADEVGGGSATDSDPSHYFGVSAAVIDIEKATEGFDADLAPGPSLAVGSAVNWTYEITNIGTETLSDVTVTDDQGVTVTCPGTTLAPGASMTCTASGVVQPGQYANIGSVTATLPDESSTGDSDPSHYFGQTLSIEKRTNGFDADLPPGPNVAPGSAVAWTYAVTNPGPETVTGLSVTDDQGVVVSCPQTTIASGETVTCTGNGTAQAGQYANVGTATATLPLGGVVSASDLSHYFANKIDIEKSTNGVDADLSPGPAVAVGSTVNWTYQVTNLGSDTLTSVTVTDDQGVTVTCPGTTLLAGESMICTASGIAVAGQYANVGTVDAVDSSLAPVSASDPSHYFGQTATLDFGDSPDPTFQVLFASNGARHVLGSAVFLGVCVDSEPDGAPGAGAAGDDGAIGTSFGTCAVAGDDEDGVTFTTPLAVGSLASVDVVAAAPCTLSAWIDYAGDGDWGDPEDALFPGGTVLVAGTNPLSFPVPATAVAGSTFARFRCTTGGAVDWTGEAADGEVEDYAVAIEPAVITIVATKADAVTTDVNAIGIVDAGDTLTYTVTITNNGSVAATGVVFSDTPDANTSLVVGSVTTSAGTVSSGNTAGDTSVAVNVGTLAAGGGTATVTFSVVLDAIPTNVTAVSNQGSVSGANFSTVLTDDPDASGGTDPTQTAVVGAASEIIPSLGLTGLIAMIAMLGLVAVVRLRGN